VSRKPRYLSGLYNYCDRWCERCEYTRQCRLAADLKKVVEDPAFRKKAEEQGAAADYLGPQQLSERARADFANWAGVIKSSKIEAE